MKYFITLIIFLAASSNFLIAQDMTPLINKVKERMMQVNNYTANGTLKTDVAFLKAPLSKVVVYYKKPDKFKMKKDGGISVLPKGGISINLNSIVAINDFVALSAGETAINGINTKVVKMLPTNENGEIVLSTLYIDQAESLVRKAVITTRENGTYEIDLQYGRYQQYGLPDKVIFTFNTKDYKLPKGITLELDQKDAATVEKLKNKKGRIEIAYSGYVINKGVDDAVFK